MKREALYLNKKPYSGQSAYINGYNGYTETKNHGLLCALIDGSCWDKNNKPNALRTKDGRTIRDKSKAGTIKN